MPTTDTLTPIATASIMPPVRPIAATDGELLMRFTRQQDEGAFAELVDRHAALVWSVCRQVLRNEADVEDAFQATFLILARRAKSIRASDSAAAWLYRVAHRTAISQWRRQRRRNEEPLNGHDPASDDADPIENLDRQHLVTVLVEELRSLPEKYQTPLVLCYLEGQSRSAAAEALDCTTAAIKGRLARGRRMLRSRLARRGVALSVASAAAATAVSSAEAAVATMSLGPATATAATSFVTGGANGAATPVCTLAQEGASTMFYASIIKPALSVAALLIVGVATAVAVQEEPPRAATAGNGAGPPTLLLADSADAAEPNVEAAPPISLPPSRPTERRMVDPAPRRANHFTGGLPKGSPPYDQYRLAPQPARVPTYPSPNTASIEQLQLERQSWETRAEGLMQKAGVMGHRFERLQELYKSNPKAVSMSELEESAIALGDASILRADAYMAKAKQLELDRRIKQLEQLQKGHGGMQPIRFYQGITTAPPSGFRERSTNSLPRAVQSQRFDTYREPPVIAQPQVLPPATSAPAVPRLYDPGPSRSPALEPVDPNSVVNQLVKELELMQKKINTLEKTLAEKERLQDSPKPTRTPRGLGVSETD